MKKATLYSSRSSRARADVGKSPTPPEKPRAAAWRAFYKRNDRLLALLGGAVLALSLVFTHAVLSPAPPALTQEALDHAIARTLQSTALPSPAAKAYEAIAPSVVRVRAIGDGLEHDEYAQRAVGSGVVIVERGVILTNLHVVAGASRIVVTFANGHESNASVVSTQVTTAAARPPSPRPAEERVLIRFSSPRRMALVAPPPGFPTRWGAM